MSTNYQLVITEDMTAIRRQYLADIQIGAITHAHDMSHYAAYCEDALHVALVLLRAWCQDVPEIVLTDFLRNG